VCDHEPRFIETSFFIASIELASGVDDGAGHAKEHLAEALARFPASPAITYLSGAYELFVEDSPQALQRYDRALTLQPAHDRALLGRIICLTNLGRHRQRKRWPIAGHAFDDARACFRDRAANTAMRLHALQARADLDPAYREHTAAGLQGSLEADGKQQHLAALMAASHLSDIFASLTVALHCSMVAKQRGPALPCPT
jgi:tetratricopeptide (TPR) repeat protein